MHSWFASANWVHPSSDCHVVHAAPARIGTTWLSCAGADMHLSSERRWWNRKKHLRWRHLVQLGFGKPVTQNVAGDLVNIPTHMRKIVVKLPSLFGWRPEACNARTARKWARPSRAPVWMRQMNEGGIMRECEHLWSKVCDQVKPSTTPHQPTIFLFRWEFEEIYVLHVLMWRLLSQAFPTTRNKPMCASQKGWARLSRAPVWMRQTSIFYKLCLFWDVKPVVVFLTEWKHNQASTLSECRCVFAVRTSQFRVWNLHGPPSIPPIFVGGKTRSVKFQWSILLDWPSVFHPNIHGLINPMNFPANPWVKNLRQQLPNPSVIEPGLSWAALKGLPGWSGRTTTKWVCLKIYWLKRPLNAENDDKPMDLEVPYFQRNSYVSDICKWFWGQISWFNITDIDIHLCFHMFCCTKLTRHWLPQLAVTYPFWFGPPQR